MNHVKNLLLDAQKKPESYWKNSSDNAIIRSFIDHSSDIVAKKLERLIAGEYVIQKIDHDQVLAICLLVFVINKRIVLFE